jgi:hypothetical protein
MREEPSLRGCRAKLDRAEEHLNALSTSTIDFLKTRPFELRGEVDKKANRYAVRIHIKQRPPERLGLIVGDAVQNLRAALDHLICNLAILGGAEDTKVNQFPILEQPPLAKQKRKSWDRMLSNVPSDAEATIEQLQPYNRPDGVDVTHHSLWIVQRLSNEDKHRVVLRAMAHVLHAEAAPFDAIPQFEPNADVGMPENLQFGSLGPLDREAELYSADIKVLGPKPELKMKGALPIETMYGEDLVPGRRLESASKRIRKVIEGFTPLFEAGFVNTGRHKGRHRSDPRVP